MMYPHQGKYLPWQKVNITQPISLLNSLLKKYPAKFALVEGKFYLNIGQDDEKTIFTELWDNDFAILLKEQHYLDLQKNQEHPHITLVNSNVISAIKDKFIEKYGTEGTVKFNSCLGKWIEAANDEFSQEANPIEFTHFDSCYSEDYSPFEETVVAKLKSTKMQKLLKMFGDTIKQEVDYIPAIQNDDSFHLTVATRYRKPNEFSPLRIEQIITSCSKKSDDLLRFLQEFKK